MRRPVLLAALAACAALLAPLANGVAGEEAASDVRLLDTLVDRYEAVRFDHSTHILMAGKCGTCHHQHAAGAGACASCHSLGPEDFRQSVKGGFLSCRTCHGTYDPAYPNVPGLKAAYHRQCFQCHRGMGDVGLDPRGCAGQCHTGREAAQGGVSRSPGSER